MLVCDGLKGLPDAVSTVWEKTIVQTCIVHLLRNSFKYASKRDWAQIAKELKPVYTAASEAEALDRFADFSGKWEKRYPAIIRLWENAWAEFVPFLQFDREIRTVICTTSAIESINARLRRAVNARGHFPTEQGTPCPAMGGRLETGPARPAAGPARLHEAFFLERAPHRAQDRDSVPARQHLPGRPATRRQEDRADLRPVQPAQPLRRRPRLSTTRSSQRSAASPGPTTPPSPQAIDLLARGAGCAGRSTPVDLRSSVNLHLAGRADPETGSGP